MLTNKQIGQTSSANITSIFEDRRKDKGTNHFNNSSVLSSRRQSHFDNGEKQLLGKVSHLIETGSNDVLVVKKCKGSLDTKERLIPYLPEQVVKLVDLENDIIEVDWDPDF